MQRGDVVVIPGGTEHETEAIDFSPLRAPNSSRRRTQPHDGRIAPKGTADILRT
jgi:hypothetical protein